MCGNHIAWNDTGGCEVQREVVGIHAPRITRTVGLDCHIASDAGICRQRHLYLPPAGARNIEGVHTNKCGQIVGVGHHSHLKEG